MKKKGFFAVVMRTKLWLLVVAMSFTGLTGAWAQTEWTAPAVPGVDLGSYDGTSAVAIYNIKADAFMGEGMNYGTMAIACRLEGGYSAALAKRQKFTLTVAEGTVKMVHANHAGRGVGCASTNANDIYADYGSNNEWTFAASSNFTNAYTLTLAGYGTLDVASKWGGKLTIKDGYGNTDWAFILETSLTNGDFAKYVERRAMYAIYDALGSNRSKYATALNTARSTYVNASATVSALRAATRTLIKAVAFGLTKPVDVSALFDNANMQQDGTNDWLSVGTVTRSAGAIENTGATTAITLTQNKTDIPYGRYDFVFRGMQRQDGTDAAPVFKVTCNGNEYKAAIPFMADLASTWNVSNGDGWAGTNGSQIPNKLWRASEGLAYEEACAKIEDVPIDNQSVTLTVTESSTSQWFTFNSFEIIYRSPLAEGAEFCTSTSDLGNSDYYYMLLDANSNGQYSVSRPYAYDVTEWQGDPAYQQAVNPLAVSSQIWSIGNSGNATYPYTLTSYVDGYHMGGGWSNKMSKDAPGAWQVQNVTNGVFKIRFSDQTGTWMGHWNDAGAAVALTDGYEGIAGNKAAANAPGYLILRMPRSAYRANRINSSNLMENGWHQVTTSDDLGRNGYEYLLLDCDKNGIESGYVLQSAGAGVRPVYKALTSNDTPYKAQRWLMNSHATAGRYSLQNVEDGNFMYCIANWDVSTTADVATTNTDFIFTHDGAYWLISNNASHTNEYLGTYSDNDRNPFQGEDVAANKATVGKRKFIILARPKGNLRTVNSEEQGWEEVTSVPSDLGNYFFAYLKKDNVGKGLVLAPNGAYQGTGLRYKDGIDPNNDRAALWTLTRDPDDPSGSVVNTSVSNLDYFLQTEDGAPQNYHIHDNGLGALSWGSVLPVYSAGDKAWRIINGKISYSNPSDWDHSHVAYGTDGSYPFYLGPWTVGDVADGSELAFNKPLANADLFQVFSITRGLYVTEQVAGKAGNQDISYIINNPSGEQYNYAKRTLGWKFTGDGFESINNTEFARKEGTWYMQSWSTKPLSDRSLYQEYTDMPVGYYTLTVNSNIMGTSGAYLFINGEQVDLGESGDGTASVTAYIYSGKLTIGIKLKNTSASWVAFDSFKLYYAKNNDISDEYFENPSFEKYTLHPQTYEVKTSDEPETWVETPYASIDTTKPDTYRVKTYYAPNYLTGWTVNNRASGTTVVTTDGKGDAILPGIFSGETEVREVDGTTNKFSDVDGTHYFNTWDPSVGSKTLDLQTTSIKNLPAGAYRLSMRLAAYNAVDELTRARVYIKVYEGENTSGTLLNQVCYSPGVNENADDNNGANTGALQYVLFTLDEDSKITVLVTTTDPGTAFFKADDLRLVSGGSRVNIAGEVLPNPSFEYADAEGNLADPAIIYGKQSGINNLGTGLSDSGIYGWDIHDIRDDVGYDLVGGGEERVVIGTDYSLDYYYNQPVDYFGIPSAASGSRYYYNQQHTFNGGDCPNFSMTTSTLTELPAGTYIANIKYKAATSFRGPRENGSSLYDPVSGGDQNGKLIEGESANLTFKAWLGNTELGSCGSGEFPLYNREHGGMGTYFTTQGSWIPGQERRTADLAGAWNKLTLVFVLPSPAAVTFEIAQQFRHGYATDVLIDDLRLLMLSTPKEPMYHEEGSITPGTDYFLMNAATGEYLMGDNENGTHAALVPHGMPFKAEAYDGGYSFDSYAYRDGSNHYLTGDWVDNAQTKFVVNDEGDGKFSVKRSSDNKYLSISSGPGARVPIGATSDAGDNLMAQWYFISKAQYEKNMLFDPDRADGTFYIPNASFSRYLNNAPNTNLWNTPVRTGSGSEKLNVAGNAAVAANNAAMYHRPFNIHKTVNVPNGTYKLRCQGFYRQDGSDNDNLPEFYANDESATFSEHTGELPDDWTNYNDNNIANQGMRSMADARNSFIEGLYYTDYVTVQVTNNLLTVGVRLDVNENLLVIWDNIEMELVSADAGYSESAAPSVAYSTIASAITTMEAAQGFEGGQWPPYTVTECKAIVDAGSIDAGYPYAYDKVASYFLGLANTEFTNAIYRGDFSDYHNYDAPNTDNYRVPAKGWTIDSGEAPANVGVVGVRPDEPIYGNTHNVGLRNVDSKKALYMAAGKTVTYGEASGYEMPLFAGVTYTLSFKYGGWGGESTINLTGVDGDGSTALAFKNSDNSAATTTLSGTQTDNANGWQTFAAIFTPAYDGDCTLNFAVTTQNAVITDLELYPHSMDVAADTYYMCNVGGTNPMYLAAGGGAAGDGISAVLTEYGGLDIGVDSYRSGISFETGIYATGEKHYLANVTDATWGTIRCDTIQSVWYATDAGIVDGKQAYYLYNASHKYLKNNSGAVALVTKPGSFDDTYKWVLKTYADRVAEMKALTADGSTTIDATFLIKGADFGYRDSRNSSWTMRIVDVEGQVIDPGSLAEANYERTDGYVAPDGWPYYTAGGSNIVNRYGGMNGNYIAESWHQSVNMYQILTTRDEVTLPMGVYTLSVQGVDSYADAPASYLYIQDADHAAYATDSVAFKRESLDPKTFLAPGYDKTTTWDTSLSKYFYEQGDNLRQTIKAHIFGSDESGNPATLKVGIHQKKYGDGGQWMVFDNFRLTYRPFVVEDKADEVTRENTYLTNIGTGAFDVPTTDTYYTAVKAKEATVSGVSTVADLRAAALALREELVDNYVDKAQVNLWKTPENFTGKRYGLVNQNDVLYYNDQTRRQESLGINGNLLTIKGAYNGTWDNIGLGFTNASGSPYPQGFVFTKVAGTTNGFTLSYDDYEGTRRYVATYAGASGSGDDYGRIRTTTTAGNALVFRVVPQTTADGTWYLNNMEKNERLTIRDAGLYNDDLWRSDYYDFGLQEVPQLEIPAEVKAGYEFSTIVLPYPAVLPKTIRAWTIDGISDGTDGYQEGYIKMTVVPFIGGNENNGTQLEACKPYLIGAEKGDEAKAAVSADLSDWGAAYTSYAINDDVYGYYSDYNTSTGDYGNSTVFMAGALEANKHVVPMSIDDDYYTTYLLTRKMGGTEKFYRYQSSATPAYCAANKAYLRVSKGAGGAKGEISFPDNFWDLADTIDETTGQPLRITGIYNTAGVKVPTLQKGLNIVVKSDGSTTKVIVK